MTSCTVLYPISRCLFDESLVEPRAIGENANFKRHETYQTLVKSNMMIPYGEAPT